MIKVVILWVAIMFSLSTRYAFSADEHGRYWVYGVGRQTCETYLKARTDGGFSEVSYKNWMSGYLTSSNRSTGDTYNLLGESDFQGALDWVEMYCKKHPGNTIYMAMANLSAVFYPGRKKSK